mmetsp:Transcript_37175/g.96464  ORF Transcript_37175/g.96464 Transcript_37175/m.96464 type:complete len:215 (-) Transcript_37175:265-909(-)
MSTHTRRSGLHSHSWLGPRSPPSVGGQRNHSGVHPGARYTYSYTGSRGAPAPSASSPGSRSSRSSSGRPTRPVSNTATTASTKADFWFCCSRSCVSSWWNSHRSSSAPRSPTNSTAPPAIAPARPSQERGLNRATDSAVQASAPTNRGVGNISLSISSAHCPRAATSIGSASGRSARSPAAPSSSSGRPSATASISSITPSRALAVGVERWSYC